MELYRVGDQVYTWKGLDSLSLRPFVKNLEPGETFTVECFEPDPDVLKRRFSWTHTYLNPDGTPRNSYPVKKRDAVSLRRLLRDGAWWVKFDKVSAMEVGETFTESSDYSRFTVERVS